MPFSGSTSYPRFGVMIDMGNPLLNRTVDGFLKIGIVAASRSAVEESYHMLKRGNISKDKLEHGLKKMCKEGAYWGTVAGVYVGLEYAAGRALGNNDWKNALVGGALTGALVSTACKNKGDQIFVDAITGGAIATAAEFLNYVT